MGFRSFFSQKNKVVPKKGTVVEVVDTPNKI